MYPERYLRNKRRWGLEIFLGEKLAKNNLIDHLMLDTSSTTPKVDIFTSGNETLICPETNCGNFKKNQIIILLLPPPPKKKTKTILLATLHKKYQYFHRALS